VELKIVADYLFNEFAIGIEEHYGSEGLGYIVRVFVEFGDNHCCGSFEVQ